MSAFIRNPGAFVVFVLIFSITPGPNNLMVTTVGVVKGRLAVLKSAAGVSVGWAIQLAVFGLGAIAVMREISWLATFIEIVAVAYLLWLAWRLWSTDHIGTATPALSFRGTLLFQWINPKAITISLSISGLFVVRSGGGIHPWSALAVAAVAALLNYPCVCLWGMVGSTLAGRLAQPGAERKFNRVAAVLLVALVVWLVIS
jgi:threonine/homoserine/homoserine lactone efflux protein